jgi:DNA topoisomerase IA
MSTHNIGTKSTKPIIIQNLFQNKYVNYLKLNITPKEWGSHIVSYWKQVFPLITDYKLTATIEKEFKDLDCYDKIKLYETKYRELLLEHLKEPKI